MLEQLEQVSPGEREDIIETVFRRFDDWEADPAACRQARRALMLRIMDNHPRTQ